jgi:hypothetical protein
VKIRFFGTVMALVISSMFLFSALAFAAEPQVVTFEGRIMDWDLKKNMIVVNEKYFFWNSGTIGYDETGALIKTEKLADQLKMNTLVNIEAVKGAGNRRFIIKKISLLP